MCVWKSEDYGTAYIAIYVDDCYCVGKTEALNRVTELLQKPTKNVEPFSVTVADGTSDYLSCEVLFSNDRKRAWLGQPHLIKNLAKHFWDIVKHLQTYRTPGTPHKTLQRDQDNKKDVEAQEHSRFRSGVGMLLYLIAVSARINDKETKN